MKWKRRSVLPRASCLYCSFNPNITEYAYCSAHLHIFKILGYNRVKALHYYIVGCLRIRSKSAPSDLHLASSELFCWAMNSRLEPTTHWQKISPIQLSAAATAFKTVCSSSTLRPSQSFLQISGLLRRRHLILLRFFFKLCGMGWDWGHSARRPPTGLLYQPRMIDEYVAFGGMRTGRGHRSTRSKPASVPIYPLQIPNHLTRDRTRAAAVGFSRLVAKRRFGLLVRPTRP
jgi:hypothetical protein